MGRLLAGSITRTRLPSLAVKSPETAQRPAEYPANRSGPRNRRRSLTRTQDWSLAASGAGSLTRGCPASQASHRQRLEQYFCQGRTTVYSL